MSKVATVIKKFFKSLGFILLGIVILLVGWITFSALNKTSPISVLPSGFTAYMRVDDAWQTVNPLLDLEPVQVLLSSPEFGNANKALVQFKQSGLRENRLFKFLAGRRIDAALYGNNLYLGSVDMGVLSCATRLLPLAASRINVKGLSYVQADGFSCFEYKTDKMVLYAKIKGNLIVVSNSKEMLRKGLSSKQNVVTPQGYTSEVLSFLKTKPENPIRLAVNIQTFLDYAGLDYNYYSKIKDELGPFIDMSGLTDVSFGITDTQINLGVKIPTLESSKDSPLANLFVNSTEPDSFSNVPYFIEYFTTLNIGSLENIKEAYKVFSTGKVDIDKVFDNANSLCNMLFSLSMEDILFSWTGKEMAIWGLENKKDPVFVMEIADEKKRQEIFNTVFKSIILKENTSLLLDGVRVPRIELPSFFNNLLKLFKINMIKPYYLVKDNFIYFSESAENLVNISYAINSSTHLKDLGHWKEISEGLPDETAVCLYYNLNRSVPFFLREKSTINNVLKMYSNGRADVLIKDKALQINLHAIKANTQSLSVISIAPKETGKASKEELFLSAEKNSGTMFYLNDLTTIVAYNLLDNKTKDVKLKEFGDDEVFIKALETPYKTNSALYSGTLWAWNKTGTVWLFSDQLELLPGFPIRLEENLLSDATVEGEDIYLVANDQTIYKVMADSETTKLEIEHKGFIRSTPAILGNEMAVYSKKLKGEIILSDLRTLESNKDAGVSIPVSGIAYGSPTLVKNNKETLVAFITQSGELSVWNQKGEEYTNFPLKLEGNFLQNVKAINSKICALSSEGILYVVSLDGTYNCVSLPNITASTGTLNLGDYNSDGKLEMLVSGDENRLYAFTEQLELVPNFPLNGRGLPVFFDVTGDKKDECFVRSLDNKIYAYKIR